MLTFKDQKINLILGKFMYQAIYGKAVFFIKVITLSILFVLDEIFLTQETSGSFKLFRYIDKLRQNNLNPAPIGLSANNNLTNLRSTTHIITTQTSRIMKISHTNILIAPLLTILTQTLSPVHSFSIITWSLNLVYPFNN